MERRKIGGSFRDYRIKFIAVKVATAVSMKLNYKFILIIIITGKVDDNFVEVS